MKKKTILITGGAGFIGINAADYFLNKGARVILFDNLSRNGTAYNLKWLKSKWGKKFKFIKGDIVTDLKKLDKAVAPADAVLHLAAQVAVTLSVQNPKKDFEINAMGTLHVLEAIRKSKKNPVVIYTSTNKVHGNLDHLPVVLTSIGHNYDGLPHGVSELCNLDFHSPYGCSKGAADQYVRDYARIFRIKSVVFRQSCIYGPHQFGMEDQGWVAWFVISALIGRKINIYGDGHQVRDVLHVNDLCRLYDFTIENPDKIAGKIFNIGGGPSSAYSILNTIKKLEGILGDSIPFSFADWRPGDQKVYISDIRKAKAELGWEPIVSFDDGLKSLIKWVKENEKLFRRLFLSKPKSKK